MLAPVPSSRSDHMSALLSFASNACFGDSSHSQPDRSRGWKILQGCYATLKGVKGARVKQCSKNCKSSDALVLST